MILQIQALIFETIKKIYFHKCNERFPSFRFSTKTIESCNFLHFDCRFVTTIVFSQNMQKTCLHESYKTFSNHLACRYGFQTCKVEGFAKVVTQPAITSSKLTIKTLEQGVIPEWYHWRLLLLLLTLNIIAESSRLHITRAGLQPETFGFRVADH